LISDRDTTEKREVCAALATNAASRHRHIVPCCMIKSASHDSVSRLVADKSMCFATASDKGVRENRLHDRDPVLPGKESPL